MGEKSSHGMVIMVIIIERNKFQTKQLRASHHTTGPAALAKAPCFLGALGLLGHDKHDWIIDLLLSDALYLCQVVDNHWLCSDSHVLSEI